MIRNTMFGLSLLALTASSAFAGTPAAKEQGTKPVAVEAAPAGDTAAPAEKTAPVKKEKKAKKAKTEAEKTEAAPKEMTK